MIENKKSKNALKRSSKRKSGKFLKSFLQKNDYLLNTPVSDNSRKNNLSATVNLTSLAYPLGQFFC